MRTTVVSSLIAVSLLLTSCANLPRSRDLGNAQVSGRTLAQQVCSTCHGVTGAATSPNFPNLAGQQREYLVSQLKYFRGQSRRDPAGFEYMWGISRTLTDAQIDALADYFSAQRPRVQPVESSAAPIAAGQGTFNAGIPDKGVPPCGSCHGSDGEGRAQFPRLAGQHADYLVKQLTIFQRTDERPEGAVMKHIAHALTPADIRNVAAYLQSVQR